MGHTKWDLKCMAMDHMPPLKRDGDCITLKKKKKKKLVWIYKMEFLIPNGLKCRVQNQKRNI